MKHAEGLAIANEVIRVLGPHCDRIEIAGSLRRKVPVVGNVQLVCIPKPYECTGMFRDGFGAAVLDHWTLMRGKLPGKEIRFVWTDTGAVVDINMCTAENWGYIMAIKTGSAMFSHHVLAKGWVKAGYFGDQGTLRRVYDHQEVVIPEEKDLFKPIGINYVEPDRRGQNIN